MQTAGGCEKARACSGQDLQLCVSGQLLTGVFVQINHPLDCPICDQGGECDLQDQVLSSSHVASFPELLFFVLLLL